MAKETRKPQVNTEKVYKEIAFDFKLHKGEEEELRVFEGYS